MSETLTLEAKPAILTELTDLIHAENFPSFPGLNEFPEKTLLEAYDTLPRNQFEDLVDWYCRLHELQNPYSVVPQNFELPLADQETLI